jgi:hypothetical protein
VLPKAGPVDGFTAAAVEHGLGQVRAALIASRLDRRMLVDHDSAAFVALLAPVERAPANARRLFPDSGGSWIATMISPRARLGPEPPRVSGRVTVLGGAVNGARYLEVVTNFVWVYAFEGPDRPVSLIHDEVRWRLYARGRTSAEYQGGLIIAEMSGYRHAMDCEESAKDLLAPPPAERAADPGKPVENPDGYFSQDRSLDVENTC